MERYIFITIGIIFTLWFLAPVFTKRIWNAGNITGLIISCCLILVGLQLPQITSCILHIKASSNGRYLLAIFFVLLLIAFAFILYASAQMFLALFQRPTEGATLVILGCKVYGTKPSLMLQERINAAYTYLQKHPLSNCVVSGGKGDDEEISEAECMYQTLVEMGLDESRIYLESASTSTRENLAFSVEIIKRQGLNQNLAIVSNEFHIYRAIKLAQKLNQTAGGIPAKTAWWLFPTYFVRELLCIINERIRFI